MLPRSNTKPIIAALGTATVITLGAVAIPATAFASDPAPTASEDPAPDPSDSPPATDPPDSPPPSTPPPDSPPPSTPPPDSPPPHTPPPSTPPPSTPALSITLALSATRSGPGGLVAATVKVSARTAVAHHAVLRFSAPSTSVSAPTALGDLGAERSAVGVVRIPAGHAAGTVKVTASLSADHATTRSASRTITVAHAAAAATLPPGLPPGLALPGAPGAVTALTGPGQAQLPLIAGQQPAVAPGALPSLRDVSLHSGASRLGLDATSYRLLWTQVAWLTALLVGVSLLLTQLRLNRHRLAARAAARRARRS